MFSDVQSTATKYGDEEYSGGRKAIFWLFSFLAAAIAFFAIIALVLTWVLDEIKGNGLESSWTGSKKTFNWHPTLAVIGLMVIMTHGMMVYRLYSRLGLTSKTVQKSVHVFLMVVALILLCVAIAAVFDYHEKQKFKDLRTMHSWLGVTTGTLFALQFLFGTVFLLPFPVAVRQVVMPYHRASGLGTLGVAAATMLSGIQEKMTLDNPGGKVGSEPRTAQSLGMMIVFLVLIVSFLLGRKEFARYQPEHEPIPEGGERMPLQASGSKN